MAPLNIRKAVLTGLAVVMIGAIWHANTAAQENSSTGVITVFDREKLEVAFAKANSPQGSSPLWSHTSSKGTYIVKTNSRDSPTATCPPDGCIHKDDFTEIMYVVSGAATLEVGGKTKTMAPDKFGGQTIQGGQSRRVSKGDMFIMPPNTPHWYKDVETPFHYIMVTVP